jgi:putative restriction endonuclease
MAGTDWLLQDEGWDTPFFKVLAHNDTGAAAGHQGGIVFPKDLRRFLPGLNADEASEESPTVDRYLNVELFDGRQSIGRTRVRYQYQTWGGTRRAESRITDGLAPLRNRATANDILLFQRRLDSLEYFRLMLIRKGSSLYPAIVRLVNGRRWGTLSVSNPPLSQADFAEAGRQLLQIATAPFQAFKPLLRAESRLARIIRSAVFPQRVAAQYDFRCCVSGVGLRTPSDQREVEAAHVVPVSEGGTDDLRNGIALTQTLHWAFDKGLFGILPGKRRVFVPPRVSSTEGNAYVTGFHSKKIQEATSRNFRVHDDALDWHMKNRVNRWC